MGRKKLMVRATPRAIDTSKKKRGRGRSQSAVCRGQTPVTTSRAGIREEEGERRGAGPRRSSRGRLYSRRHAPRAASNTRKPKKKVVTFEAKTWAKKQGSRGDSKQCTSPLSGRPWRGGGRPPGRTQMRCEQHIPDSPHALRPRFPSPPLHHPPGCCLFSFSFLDGTGVLWVVQNECCLFFKRANFCVASALPGGDDGASALLRGDCRIVATCLLSAVSPLLPPLPLHN
jgi:hypothetical protein